MGLMMAKRKGRPGGRAERAILAALRAVAVAASERAIATGQADIPDEARKRFQRAMAQAWAQGARSGVSRTLREIGAIEGKAEAEQNLWEQFAEEYARLYGSRAITAILETTRAQIIDLMRQGLADGKSVDEIAKAVRTTIPAMTARRAALIARTETHSAANYSAIRTAKTQSRWPLQKMWISVVDHRTRDFGEGDGTPDQANHRQMRGVKAAIDDPFQVPNKFGGTDAMQYPGDQSAPAYQVCNCRCTVSFRPLVSFIA